MGSVFRKTTTRPMPKDAEIIDKKGERWAKWRTSNGKLKTALVIVGQDGAERIRTESQTFLAKYRDENGLLIERPTGCRDESAARQVLADWEKRVEQIRVGVVTPAQARALEHKSTLLAAHVADYIVSLEAMGASAKHVYETRRILERTFDGCGFKTLADLDRSTIETWLNRRRKDKVSPRTRNIDLAHATAFANWCVENGRLTLNPFLGVAKANEAEKHRRRRALTADELTRLLDATRRRPLLEALTIRTGKDKGQASAQVRDEVRMRLERLGQERALIYMTLALTGLRRNELATLTVGQLQLDGSNPHAQLDPTNEKNREGNVVALPDQLANELRVWLDDKLADLQIDAQRKGKPVPTRLSATSLIFVVPKELVKIFDRDLELAGIAKHDDRGRTLDIHALRHTFGTLLAGAGVPLRTAQAAMRHSDPKLTANVYTDPRLLDVGGAVNSLPKLVKLGSETTESRVHKVKTESKPTSLVAPAVAPNLAKSSQNGSFPGNLTSDEDDPDSRFDFPE